VSVPVAASEAGDDTSAADDVVLDQTGLEDSDATDDDLEDRPRDHVTRRSVILPDHKILFMPMPKAACTTILWQLAGLAGMPVERFEASALPEVSTALTIHDMARWDPEYRWNNLDEQTRQEILRDDSWFRFTIVRNPASRVWSAWQSKLLLREPRWLREWGDRPWFPRLPSTPDELIEDFRKFVLALADPEIEDVHWTVQHELTDALSFNHIGRSESLDETVAALTTHLADLDHDAQLHPGRENRAPLAFPRSAYDEAGAVVMNDRYAADFDKFGYEPVSGALEDDTQWAAAVEPILPLLAELVDRNTRVGQLSEVARSRGKARRRVADRLYKTEQRLETVTSGRARGAAPLAVNVERRTDFTVRWAWEDGPLDPGFTAVVRVKNEARPLPYVLPPLLRAVKRVVLVDNASTDGTPEIAEDVAAHSGAADKLTVVAYPFDVARCGADHLGTPAASVHSLTYFYNWSFSQVRTSYALKWDGDMVLTETGVKALQDLDWQLEASLRIITMPRYPLYIADRSTAFLDVGLANNEPWGWPNRPGYSHVKAMEWELPLWPEGSRNITLPEWSCIELKWLDADEFDHWTTNDFTATARTRRKEREWRVYQSLNAGEEPPEGVVAVTAPAGRDVVDYVRGEWMHTQRDQLDALARELTKRRELAMR
jgi:hypothetical protein